MLGLRYDTPAARAMARRISEVMRDAAYGASVELAKERGAFPLFNAELYLSGGNFASRLPADIKAQITGEEAEQFMYSAEIPESLYLKIKDFLIQVDD